MKRVLLLTLLVMVVVTAFADSKKKKASTAKPITAQPVYIDSTEIQWLTWEQAQAKMKEYPKKIWVDVYTDWCGWCKRMDATTFKNKELVKYMNAKFYAVKFNAEGKDSILFQGKKYGFVPDNRANQLAIDLMKGQMTYPTYIFMEEFFKNAYPIPGYQPVPEMEKILKYLGDNIYRDTKYEEYISKFQPTWETAN